MHTLKHLRYVQSASLTASVELGVRVSRLDSDNQRLTVPLGSLLCLLFLVLVVGWFFGLV